MKHIAVVTGSRAEWGLLRPLLQRLANEEDVSLSIIVTGAHLVPSLGDTAAEIDLPIAARVDMLLAADTPVAVAKSIGLGTIGMAEAIARLAPDLLLVLGDRYEILAAAQAALVMRLPIAHIAGGDVTEGAYDDAIRHAISKMAHLHFVTNEPARQRLVRMGELPAHVWNVGHIGLDDIHGGLQSRAELETWMGAPLRDAVLLVTYHPETLAVDPASVSFARLLQALSGFDHASIVFTHPNADTAGRSLIPMIDDFVREHPGAVAFPNLGRARYLSFMRLASAVVGNSSSGLYEAPSFKVPTVNIGGRQEGRIAAESVITVPCERDAIRGAIDRALAMDCSGVVNPYGGGGARERIVEELRRDHGDLLRKRFHDGGAA